MNNGRQLFLHIGSHKTGTTSIQCYLKEQKKELNAAGWELFHTKPEGFKSKLGNANSWVEFSGFKEDFQATINPDIYSYLKRGKCNTILSSEELFWLYDEKSVSEFYDNLSKIFSNITICCYVRRQDLHFLSHFQQGFRSPNSSAQSFFGRELSILPEHQEYFRRYLDYSKKLSYWEKYFGIENLIVKEFDYHKLKNGDAVSDFIDLLPFKLTNINSTKEKSNESLNVLQTIVNFSVFETHVNLWNELGKNNFSENAFFNYTKKAKLSSRQSIKILENYSDSNIEIQRYIKNLSSDWYEPQNIKHEDSEIDCDIEIDDYKNALLALTKYYDSLTIIDSVKVKLRRFSYHLRIEKNARAILQFLSKNIIIKIF